MGDERRPDDGGRGKGGKPRRERERLRVARRDAALAGEGDVVALPTQATPAWEFVHPRCARKRREDIEEVEAMLEEGEIDVAREELVWLLSECPDFLEGHLHLGLLALEEDDPKLARGHFGRAVELGFKALEEAGHPRPLPALLPGNRVFFESAKGLVHALVESGKRGMALDTAKRVVALDPSDPLGIAGVAAGKEGDRG